MASEMVTVIPDGRMSTGVISATVRKCDCCERQLSYVDKWEPGRRWHSGTIERMGYVAPYAICEQCEDRGWSSHHAAYFRAERVSPRYAVRLFEGLASTWRAA